MPRDGAPSTPRSCGSRIELFRNSFVNDADYKALTAEYDVPHTMDAVMTVADFLSLGSIYNALGVQPDAWTPDRIPTNVPYPSWCGPGTWAGGATVSPASATVDFRRYLDALYEGGFDGVLSVEHEDPIWGGSPEMVEKGLEIAHRNLRPLVVA